MFDFANILLSGKCNARCPFCIGRRVDPRLNRANLDEYPPRNLYKFINLIRQEDVRQVVVTGTNTDPQIYRYEALLLHDLRQALPRGTQISLHTNGRMALRKMVIFNQYDRVTISLPSFASQTYRKMMGVAGVPDLYEIVRGSSSIIKISCIITDDNAMEIGSFLERCGELGVQRVVLRKRYGDRRTWQELLASGSKPNGLNSGGADSVRLILEQIGKQSYRGNPMIDLPGIQITLWDFEQTKSTSINLFSSGLISRDYLLAQAGEIHHREHREEL